ERPGDRGIGGSKRRRWIVAILALVALLLLVGCAWLFSLQPSNSRDWAADQETPASTTIDGDSLYVRNVRDFRYDSAGHATPHYYDAAYDLDSVRTAWFIL